MYLTFILNYLEIQFATACFMCVSISFQKWGKESFCQSASRYSESRKVIQILESNWQRHLQPVNYFCAEKNPVIHTFYSSCWMTEPHCVSGNQRTCRMESSSTLRNQKQRGWIRTNFIPRANPDTFQEVMSIANVAFLLNSSDFFVVVVRKVIHISQKKKYCETKTCCFCQNQFSSF